MVNTAKLISLYSTRPLVQTRFSRWKEGSWVAIILFTLPLHAQVITDGTVGDAVTLSGQDVKIAQDLGTLQGNNLFHSFQTFNIQSNGSVTFTGANSINNVISRVTGGEISNIDGTLRSEMVKANFFILNPAGVIFGAGAKVDVPASFHISTADDLRFADGAVYSATNPNTSTLTLAAPEAFGFLGQNQSSVTLDQAQLAFQRDSDVSIVSNDITIQGGGLITDGGDLRLIAQGNKVSTIPITGDVVTAAVGSLLVASSSIDGGDDGGNIILHAGDMLITDNTQIRSTNVGDVSSIGTDVEFIASDLTISNGVFIFVTTRSAGRGGDVLIVAEKLMIDGQDSSDFTAIYNETYSDGSTGDIAVNAGSMIMVNGGEISNSVKANRGFLLDNGAEEGGSESDAGTIIVNPLGNVGTIIVNAEQLVLDGASIRSRSELIGEDSTGFISVNASSLAIVNGGSISGSSFTANAATVNVNAKQLVLDHGFISSQTGLSLSFDGDGGDINVTSNELRILRGGQINASSDGGDQAGVINVNTGFLFIDGRNRTEFTGIASTSRFADAGSINVIAEEIVLHDGQITTSTSGATSTTSTSAGLTPNPNGGPITISGDVLVLNGGFIQANALSGQGGDITIDTDAVVATSNKVLIGGEDRLIFENNGPNVMQAVAPDGVNGLVDINAPDIDVSGSLLALDPSFADITGLAFDPCAAFVSGAPSTFTVSGRGGLPNSSSGNISFSLTGELLDQLLDDVSADTHLTTIDRVHSTKLSFTINAMTGLPVASSHGSAFACS